MSGVPWCSIGARAVKLIKSEIDALTCPQGRRDLIVFDDDLHGFGLRVTEKGAKTFILQYQTGGRAGRRTRMVLGTYGEVTPAAARRMAEVARAKVRLGQDPAAERKAVAATRVAEAGAAERARVADAFTFGALIGQWAATGLADRSPAHRIEAPRALRTGFASLLGCPAHLVGSGAVQQLIDGMAMSRPVVASRTRDYGRAAFNWAIGRRLVAANPFTSVKLDRRELSRDRVLSDAELREAWCAAAIAPYPFGPLIRLLILTLQRRGEVAGMRWAELTPDLSVWTIPGTRSKNRKAHIVHMAEPARAILRGVPRADGQRLVFTTNNLTPVSGFSKAHGDLKAAIAKQRPAVPKGRTPPAAPYWHWHDFRRTGVTGLARLGYAVHVADRLLNHVQGSIKGVMAVYQRHEFLKEREAALRAWAEHVLTVADGRGE